MISLYGLLIISFLIRVFFTFYKNNHNVDSYTADENGHLAHERLLSEPDLKNYLKKRFYNRTTIGYPYLMHKINNFLFKNDFSLQKRRTLVGIYSLLFPIIFLAVGVNYYPVDSVVFATIALLVSLSTFGLFIMNYRSYTGRPLADFLIWSGYFFIILNYNTHADIYYILAIFAFSLVWLSSTFGVQSIILTSILWSIISRSTLPLEVLFLSFILALIFSKKMLIDILNHKIFHWIRYARNQDFLYKSQKVEVKSLKDFYHRIVLSHISINKLFQFCPFFVIFLFVAIMHFDNYYFENSFIISTAIISILTIIKPFAFLGPSYRYISYALPFIWIEMYQFYPKLSLFYYL